MVDAGVAVGPKTATIRPTTEIFIVTSFPDPWTSEADEVRAMRANSWEPSDTAFAAATSVHSHNFAKVSTLGEFLGAVINTFSGTPRPKGSVGRINLLTHGDTGLFGLSGTVVVKRDASGNPVGEDVFFTRPPSSANVVTLSYSQIDTAAVNWLNDAAGGQSARDDFRAALTPDAGLFLYACHGGAAQGLQLCIDLSFTLNLAVHAFRDAVQYEPTFEPTLPLPNKPDRVVSRNVMFYQTGAHLPGYKHMKPDVNEPKPAAPTP